MGDGDGDGDGDEALVEAGTCRDLDGPALLWLVGPGGDGAGDESESGGGACWGEEECGVVMAILDEDGQVTWKR